MAADDGRKDRGESLDFIRSIVSRDVAAGKNEGQVRTRFPPEPNGYLHIGHAKAICLDFGVAADFNGTCNLRFDDTNPAKEDMRFVEAQKEDVRWLGFDWGDRLFFASDYYEKLYAFAVELIKKGKAYVDSLNPDQIREYRGTPTEPGRDSPYRGRSVQENLDLFTRMRNGEFDEGACVLRAKIDMASPNIVMRDPTIYRTLKVPHYRTGSQWCVYPMYDFAHCLSDSLEGITHSFCTVEYEIHRPLYDWFILHLDTRCHPQQIEFAPLALSHTVLSKRKLLRLLHEGHVDGWDDPRMPTLAGMRRRGIPPQVIRDFCSRIGISKTESVVDIAFFEHLLREELNKTAPRAMAVLNPLKLIIDNYPEGKEEELEAENIPENPEAGTRILPFSRILFIEKEDYREDPPKKYFRLAAGREIRLKHAYYIKCVEVEKDSSGRIVAVHCTYDPTTRGGWSDDGRKVRGTSHWVSAAHAVSARIRLLDHLFTAPNPEEDGDFLSSLNPASMTVLEGCLLEPQLRDATPGTAYQFLRQGYFCIDAGESTPELPVFTRAVALRDTWAKMEKKQAVSRV